MSSMTVCDLCGKKVSYKNQVVVKVIGSGRFEVADYCGECWSVRKNWAKIHQSKLKRMV